MARKAYCTGCGVTFPQMHLLRQHRNLMRCGGRFNSLAKLLEIEARRPKKTPKISIEQNAISFMMDRCIIEDKRWLKRISNENRVDARFRQSIARKLKDVDHLKT